MADPKKKVVRVFSEAEAPDDANLEQEELGEGQQPVEGPVETPPTDQPLAEAKSERAKPYDPSDPEEKLIPRQRLIDKQQELDAALTEAQKLREQWARLDERQVQAKQAREEAQRQAHAAEQAAQRPDPAIDPVGAKQWDHDRAIEQMNAQLQQVGQFLNQFQQGYQQNQQEQEHQNRVVAEAQTYAREQPDYFDAANYLAKWRTDLYQKAGLNEQQARELALREGNFWVSVMQQTGKHWPSFFYQAAQSLGYKPAVANGNGRPVTPEVSAAGRTLAQAAKGQALQGMNRIQPAGNEGKSRYAGMSAADIAAVPDGQWQRDWQNPQLRPEMEAALRRLDGIEGADVQYFSGSR